MPSLPTGGGRGAAPAQALSCLAAGAPAARPAAAGGERALPAPAQVGARFRR